MAVILATVLSTNYSLQVEINLESLSFVIDHIKHMMLCLAIKIDNGLAVIPPKCNDIFI